MKKLLLALTLVLCLAISMVAFTSCGGNGEGEDCEHIWGSKATTDKAATCTEEGSESIKCAACGEKKADSVTAIPATGHNYQTDSVTQATCSTDGTETKVCANCGDSTTTTTPATGNHTWGNTPTVDIPAGCDTPGEESIKCVICQTKKDGSTNVIPAAHSWSIIATADTNPTCTEEGIKSIKCYRCQAKQPGSEEAIPATGHSAVPVVVTPTFFSEGLAEGPCESCNEIQSYTVPKTEVKLNVINTSHNKNNIPQQTASIADALGDKSFLPTNSDGTGANDLYLEFSILWNDTMSSIQGSGIGFGSIANSADVDEEDASIIKPFSWLYYNSSARWCPFVGGFEFSEGQCIEGPVWKENSTSRDDFTIIEGLDGWHRIGLKYHQEFQVSGGKVVSEYVTVTVYVDGEETNKIRLDWGAFFYSTALVNGELVFTESIDVLAHYAVFYRVGNGALKDGVTDDAYFPFADCILSVGDGFVLDVEPVENPEAQDFTQGDVTLSGKMYYQLKTAE